MPINPGRIVYEDQWYLAVHKLPAELVVKGKGPVGKLPLFDFLRKDYPGIHPINRIDFETSGIVLFAKTKPVLAKTLDTKFDQWEKKYRTIVAGRLQRREGDIRFALPTRAKGEEGEAHTHYYALDVFDLATYVEVTIATGRHHQIRRHFAKIGHPLVLDYVYGDPKFNNHFSQKFRFHRFFLHAGILSFPHPYKEGEKVTIEDPLPRPFEELLQKLRDDERIHR